MIKARYFCVLLSICLPVLSVHANTTSKHTLKPTDKKPGTQHTLAAGWRDWNKTLSGNKWSVTAGGSSIISTKNVGFGGTRFMAIPFFNITYKKRVIISSFRGIGVFLLNKKSWKSTLAVNYNFRSIGAIKNNTPGFAKVKTYLTANASLQWRWRMFGARTLWQQPITSNYGGTWNSNVSLGAPLGRYFILTNGPTITYATKRYMQIYYGVSTSESEASGLPPHHVTSGIMSLGDATNLMWFHGKWFAQGLASLNWLQGSASTSPLIQKKFYYATIFSLGYKFM